MNAVLVLIDVVPLFPVKLHTRFSCCTMCSLVSIQPHYSFLILCLPKIASHFVDDVTGNSLGIPLSFCGKISISRTTPAIQLPIRCFFPMFPCRWWPALCAGALKWRRLLKNNRCRTLSRKTAALIQGKTCSEYLHAVIMWSIYLYLDAYWWLKSRLLNRSVTIWQYPKWK